MGQQEVYDFLKKNKGSWFTSKDIAKIVKVSIGSVTSSLKKLRTSRSINFKESGRTNMYLYKYKG